MTNPISIGRTHIRRVDGWARLEATIAMNNKATSLWFGVRRTHEDTLLEDVADPFVALLLPLAARYGLTINHESPISEKMSFQIAHYLLPAMTRMYPNAKRVRLEGPTEKRKVPGKGSVMTGYSGGVDSLYTILSHTNEDALYPLTHLVVFNNGVFEGAEVAPFKETISAAQKVASELSLSTMEMDTNLSEALPERFLDVYTFRNLACALALQGACSTYLLSSGHDASHFALNPHNTSEWDLLTTQTLETERLRIYLSGMEKTRVEKIEALSDWDIAKRYLHPCFVHSAGHKNCGHCKKCSRDFLTLKVLNKLDDFEDVIDVQNFERYLPVRIGFVLANKENHLYKEVIDLMQDRNFEIPNASWKYAEQFEAAKENLRRLP